MTKSSIVISSSGQLLFDRTLADPFYAERIIGDITGLIEFEDEPEFCNDDHIYFWKEDEDGER